MVSSTTLEFSSMHTNVTKIDNVMLLAEFYDRFSFILASRFA